MKRYLKAMIIALTIILLTVTVSYAETNASSYGLIASPYGNVEIRQGARSGFNKANNLPAKYDVRDLSYGGKIKVKNQNPTGLCWAFSATTCMEISYMQQQMLAGETPEYKQLSPLHFGYFFWNRVTDPLGLTAGDSNNIYVGGSDEWKYYGGNDYYTAQALANWGGMASESKVPFDAAASSVDSRYAYDDELILKEARYLTSAEEIKEAILENGAVVTAIYMNNWYMNENAAYNVTEDARTNHEVVIIGWDDSYPKENFSEQPEEDGAWICQNSYGKSFGENGYFYISYESYAFENPVELVAESAKEHDYNYQYDGTAGSGYSILNSGYKVANFYTASGSDEEVIDEIGLTIATVAPQDSEKSLTVNIYSDASTTSDIFSSKRVASFDITTHGGGCFFYEVPTEVKLKKGDRFAVEVVANSDNVNFGLDMSTSESSDSEMGFKNTASTGQSYISTGYSWTDYGQNGKNFRIKVLTSVVGNDSGDTDPDDPVDPSDPENPGNLDVNRIFGSNRYETSLKIATERKNFLSSGGKYDQIYVASGANYPDALAGGYLANTREACLITVDAAHEQQVINYIKSNLVENGAVDILGGNGAVSASFERKLRNALSSEASVGRIAGANRYETNLAILGEDDELWEETIYVCSGSGFADSLSASSTSMPILLVGTDLTSKQVTFLKNHPEVKDAVIIGGTGAVSPAVETKLRAIYGSKKVKRLAGANRYETSYLVAMESHDPDDYYCSPSSITLAYGQNFPDGLSGGPLANANFGPLILVEDNVTQYAEMYIRQTHRVGKLYVLGGPALISDASVSRIVKNAPKTNN